MTVEHRHGKHELGRDGQAGVRGHGVELPSPVLFCFVSFGLCSPTLCPLSLPSVLLIRLHGDTEKSEQACKRAGPALVCGTCLGIYQGTRNRVPKGPTLESSARARISAEVGGAAVNSGVDGGRGLDGWLTGTVRRVSPNWHCASGLVFTICQPTQYLGTSQTTTYVFGIAIVYRLLVSVCTNAFQTRHLSIYPGRWSSIYLCTQIDALLVGRPLGSSSCPSCSGATSKRPNGCAARALPAMCTMRTLPFLPELFTL